MQAVMETADLMEQVIRSALGRSWPMHKVLSAVVAAGGRCFIGEAVAQSARANSTITDILDRAERHGYIIRERGGLGQDRRKIYLVITEEGRRVHGETAAFLSRFSVPQPVLDYLAEVIKHLQAAG